MGGGGGVGEEDGYSSLTSCVGQSHRVQLSSHTIILAKNLAPQNIVCSKAEILYQLNWLLLGSLMYFDS